MFKTLKNIIKRMDRFAFYYGISAVLLGAWFLPDARAAAFGGMMLCGGLMFGFAFGTAAAAETDLTNETGLTTGTE